MEEEKEMDTAVGYFERVLKLDPSREDIRELLDKVKVKLLAEVSIT